MARDAVMLPVLFAPARHFAAELRTAWASGRRVALTLTTGGRLEGFVERISATDAFVRVRGQHVPLDVVAAVYSPSRLGDSTARGGRFHGAPRRVMPQVEMLWSGGP